MFNSHPDLPVPMLAGSVDAPGGYICTRRESTPFHASTRTASCRFRQSQKKKTVGSRLIHNMSLPQIWLA
jgi:hypothetical protein